MKPRSRKSKKVRKEDMQVWGKPLAVRVVDGNIEQALRLFKRIVKESGNLQELKDRRYYTKPSEKRRKVVQSKKRLNKFKNNND